jgi:hypothetical protein
MERLIQPRETIHQTNARNRLTGLAIDDSAAGDKSAVGSAHADVDVGRFAALLQFNNCGFGCVARIAVESHRVVRAIS